MRYQISLAVIDTEGDDDNYEGFVSNEVLGEFETNKEADEAVYQLTEMFEILSTRTV